MLETEQNKNNWGWLLYTAIIFFIVALLVGGYFYVYEFFYRDRIYPGVSLNSIDLGGMRTGQLESLLELKRDQLNEQGIKFSYQTKQYALLPTIASENAELAISLIEFKTDETAKAAMAFGRDGGVISNLLDRQQALFYGHDIAPRLSINYQAAESLLRDEFAQFYVPSKNAGLVYDARRDYFSVSGEQSGWEIDYAQALAQMAGQLSRLDFSPIAMEARSVEPQIHKREVLNANIKAKEYLALAPITLSAASTLAATSSWAISKASFGAWLGLRLNPDPQPDSPAGEDKIAIGLNRDTAAKFLTEKVAPAVEQKPAEAKFEVASGKVAIFQSAQNGLMLDLDQNLKLLEEQLIDRRATSAKLVLTEVINEIASSTNDFGIKEIVGVGKSNFAGSPKNRRHNIKVGADTLHGILIKPGETFSLVKTLGDISSSTGYLPELVIKGSRTVPEFGGGLCQIGTTMFRAALATGLPIIERRNHSYRVVYYEPAGTDATIYDPSPDLKFLNDTNNYILIQARIAKDDLSFSFWGTSDGRVASQTKPIISNIVKPPPTKIIETLELPVGQKKCTEKAHNGADTYFDYTVTYSNGEKKEKRFNSHYIPWREVCLIGVDKLSVPAGDASTTPAATTSAENKAP